MARNTGSNGGSGDETTTTEEKKPEATLLVTLNPDIDLVAYEFEDGTGLRRGVPKRVTESVYATNGEKKLDGRKIMVKE